MRPRSAALSRYFDGRIQYAMRNAIIELVLLTGAVVLWTLLAVPGLLAHGMNWLNVLVYVLLTTESTRLCVTGRAFFVRRQAVVSKDLVDANKSAAQDRAALRKAS